VEYRAKALDCLMGGLRVSRAYYHCAHCRQGFFPWDAELRLAGRLTPGAEEVVALAGILESFGKAERTLRKMTGLRLSASTEERTTEAAGARLGKWLEQGVTFGPRRAWKWNRDASGRTCAYLSVDATGILMQGPDAGKVDGRMVNVAMIYNPQPRAPDDEALAKPCLAARYLAGLYTLPELGKQLRRQGAQVGMDAAEVWVALTDGGNGLEEFVDVHFPRAVKILDFQHAAGYLASLAKLLRSGTEAEELLTQWCHLMKHEGGTRILQELADQDRRKMSRAARAEHERVCNYIRNNVHRMNYPEYQKQGWHIATGAVESACKTVVNQRLCQGGMRWGEFGSDALAHLRALYRSDDDQWDAFWIQPRKAA
jgi:hypothetical protein